MVLNRLQLGGSIFDMKKLIDIICDVFIEIVKENPDADLSLVRKFRDRVIEVIKNKVR